MESMLYSAYSAPSSCYQISDISLPILIETLALSKTERLKPPKQCEILHSSVISQKDMGEK